MRPAKPRIGKIVPGTFAHVIRQFMASAAYAGKAQATRDSWARALRIAEEEAGLGGCSVQVIRPAIIQGFLDAMADTPGKQTVARTALKAVEKFAVVRDLVPMPFMTGTSTVGSDGGFEPWPESMVDLALEKAAPMMARAVLLAVNTGQRGSDTVRMRPNDIEERLDRTTGMRRRGIVVTQQKTGKKLWVPFIDPAFEATIAGWEKLPGPFLRQDDGKPFYRNLLSNHWNRERDGNDALAPLREAKLVLHGLRATAVVRARKRGLSDLQIANLYGMSPPMVARYSRLADQGDMAMAAVHFLDRTSPENATGTVTRNSSNVTKISN